MADYLTIPQAAEALGLHRSRVWVLANEHRIAVETIAGHTLISRRELARFKRIERKPGRPRTKTS